MTRFLSTAVSSGLWVDVLGTRIIPPSKASTNPAPLDVQTEYLSTFRTANLAFDHCEYHPNATVCQSNCPNHCPGKKGHGDKLTEEDVETMPDDVPDQFTTGLTLSSTLIQ